MSRLRQIKRIHASHMDDWLVTYADTITLLLCLFVLLLASHAHKLGQMQDLTPATVAEQPVVPDDFLDWKPPFQPIASRNEGDNDADPAAHEGATQPLEEEQMLPTPARNALAAVERTITSAPPYWQSIDPPAFVSGISQSTPPPLADALTNQASSPSPMPPREIAARVGPEHSAHIEQKGDRITTLAFDSAAFFSRGDAILNGSGKVILQEVIGNLKSEEYRDYMITIEGHTDDTPINTAQFPSNWELSTARAAAVVRFFVEQGVSTHQVRAAGYADTHPLQPNRDGNGIAITENQAKNRRVVIGLEKIERR